MARSCAVAAIAAVLLSSTAAADVAERWTQLKTGMSADEATAALGRPLIRTAGRGFELWIYDSRAEVLFFDGPVVAWTAPVPNPVSEARPVELDVTRGVFFLPAPRPGTNRGRAPAVGGYLETESRFRYRGR